MIKEPKVKLTLTVKKSVIEDAKKYATSEATSLSNLVEEYLMKYSRQHQSKEDNAPDITELLYGFAKDSPMSKMTDKEIKDLWLKEEYNL